MTREKAIEVLTKHNEWRRDDNDLSIIRMQDPKELGLAIDLAIKLLTKQKTIKNPTFRLGQKLYHVCDTDQNPMIVTGVVHRGDNFYTYLTTNSCVEKECSEMELTTEKIIF